MARDIYAEVTDRILAALEAGTKPWEADWLRTGPALRISGEEYRGINQILLTMAASGAGYASPTWMTFKQALELGGAVRKGERSCPVVFFKTLEVDDNSADAGEDRTKRVPILRGYNVFNVDQIEGLPARFHTVRAEHASELQRDQVAEAAIRSSGAAIYEGGDRAFYDRQRDAVQLPNFERFHSVGGFLATMAHEVIHWTGAETRLDRVKGRRFGDTDYAFEELVAEIGAAFICGRLGVAGAHIESHASYLSSWLKALRNDKRCIFKAASLAQAAADLALANAADDRPELVERSAPAPAAQLALL